MKKNDIATCTKNAEKAPETHGKRAVKTPEKCGNNVGNFWEESCEQEKRDCFDVNDETHNTPETAFEQQNGFDIDAETHGARKAKNDARGKKRHAKSGMRATTKLIAFTGVMTGMVTVATLLGFSTAEFYFNVGDTVIIICAAIFGPVPAMIAGGLGSFFADLAVYPATMIFTLFIKGFEGLLCGLLLLGVRKLPVKSIYKTFLSIAAAAISAFCMAAGYFMCQTLFYGTYAAAIVALPIDALQAACSVALSSVMLYLFGLVKFRERLNTNPKNSPAINRGVNDNTDE